MDIDWTDALLEQLTVHWDQQARPRLDGLTDHEYRWEPVPGAWNLRPRAEATTGLAAGAGELVLDFEYPDPDPAPFTTIAWRLAHVSVSVFGMRNANHFGGSAVDYWTVDWPADAEGALALLDDAYARWVAGVRGLGLTRLGDPVGPSEGLFADHPYATLVLHIHREAIHHLAEIALLRDLYAHRSAA